MKKLLIAIPLVIGLLFGLDIFASKSEAALNKDLEAIKTAPTGELTAPQNTKCRKIDFKNDTKRTAMDKRTTFTGNGTDPVDGKYYMYDLCIGSFPRFPSTSVEGGIKPFYYAKYYFIPDPMPVYDVTQNKRVVNGTTIVGLDQKFVMNTAIEDKNKPSDQDIFLFYPYDKAHASVNPVPNPSIKGPYQIAYNSFYHNTYRSRYFSSITEFDFYVLEPKKGDSFYNAVDKVKYDDKTILFSGTIVYDMPDTCYRNDYLDYADNCRDIEFYFPKAESATITEPKIGTLTGGKWDWGRTQVENVNDVNEDSKNVISKNRKFYMNPGEHYLVLNVTENTQLRYQKDEGAEFQTLPKKTNNQGAGSVSSATNGSVYFPRLDMGGGVNPHFTTSTLTAVGNDIVAKQPDGFYVYQFDINTDFINYCDNDTGAWGAVNNTNRGTTGNQLNRTSQVDTGCYHNEGKDFHFWKYYWADSQWYAADPKKW